MHMAILLIFMITDGTTHDVKVAPDFNINIIDLKETKVVCADKGYDSEPLRESPVRKTRLKQIYQRKQIANRTMTIWTGVL